MNLAIGFLIPQSAKQSRGLLVTHSSVGTRGTLFILKCVDPTVNTGQRGHFVDARPRSQTPESPLLVSMSPLLIFIEGLYFVEGLSVGYKSNLQV